MSDERFDAKMRTAFALAEAAREVGVSVVHLRREIKRGQLAHIRCGNKVLILADDLMKYLNARRVPATDEAK
jgi:excisionase family DNA binding protein